MLAGNLWEYNLTKVIIIDVSDDYRFMQSPMPSDFYPVLAEAWLPTYRLDEQLPIREFVSGYLYDWHEISEERADCWYVGVVKEELAQIVFRNVPFMR